MSEALYPHEVIIKYLNSYKFAAACSFVWAGMNLGVFCKDNISIGLVIFCIFFVIGLIFCIGIVNRGVKTKCQNKLSNPVTESNIDLVTQMLFIQLVLSPES